MHTKNIILKWFTLSLFLFSSQDHHCCLFSENGDFVIKMNLFWVIFSFRMMYGVNNILWWKWQLW